MHAADHDELRAQRAFLNARLTDLQHLPDGAGLEPAVRALSLAVATLVEEAGAARARGDHTAYTAAVRRLRSVSDRWDDHPDHPRT